MWLHVTNRPALAGWRKAFFAPDSGAMPRQRRAPAATQRPITHPQRPTSVFCAALVWLGLFGVLAGAEQRIGPSSRDPPAIVVTQGPGGVAIWSDDAEALDRFTQLFVALASVRSAAKEETVVYYLKHAKAAAVAEILEAVFSGGSLAEEPRAAGPFFRGFGSPGAATGGFGPGGPFGGFMGFASPFGRSRDSGDARGQGSPPGSESGGPLTPGRNAAQQRSAASSRTSSGVRITPDSRLNALIVQAKPGDMEIIEELVKILDQQGTPEAVAAEPRPRLIPVRHVPVQSVLGVLRQVYQDRLTNAGSSVNAGARGGSEQASGVSAPGSPGLPGFPQGPGGPGAGPGQFFQQLAMAASGAGRRGRAGLGTEEQPKMSLGADARSNSLVVVAPDRLYEEVRELVRQLDRPATEDAEAIQVLALRGGNTELVRRALPAFMGDRVRVSQSSASPTSNGRRMRDAAWGGWRQRGLAGEDRPGGSPGSGTNDLGTTGAQPAPGSPTIAFPPGSPGVPGMVGQDRFGPGGAVGAASPNPPSVPPGPAPDRARSGAPLGREQGPPQPPDERAPRGPLPLGPGEPPPALDSDFGPPAPAPSSLP